MTRVDGGGRLSALLSHDEELLMLTKLDRIQIL